jgi:hypothetical protein
MKTERVSLQNKYVEIQPFITANKRKEKKTKNKNKDAPRTTYSIWSNKNIVS